MNKAVKLSHPSESEPDGSQQEPMARVGDIDVVLLEAPDTPAAANPAIVPKVAQLLEFAQKNSTSVTPREINASLAQVLQGYDELTAVYAQNKQRIDAELAEIRQMGQALMGRLQLLDTDVQQQHSALQSLEGQTQAKAEALQTEWRAQLAATENRLGVKLGYLQSSLGVDLAKLGARMDALDRLLDSQESLLEEQTTRLDQFGVAQELLDTATRGNRNRIEVVRELSEKQHALVRAQLEGLNALQREHYKELETVRHWVGELSVQSQQLGQSLGLLERGLESHTQQTHVRFRRTHLALAALALMGIAALAAVKWMPQFAPESTVQDLVRLDQQVQAVAEQVDGLHTLSALGARQEVAVDALTQRLERLERGYLDLRSVWKGFSAAGAEVNLSGFPPNGPRWLQQQDPGAYTVQLLGVHAPYEVTALVSQHGGALSQFELAYAITLPQQGPRYNVFYGVFADTQQAQSAIDALPEALQANQPWVRPMRSVQNALP